MQDQDKAKLKLRVKPIQPVQVNRPVVLTIVGVTVFVILFAVINAFNVKKTVKSTGGEIKAATDRPMAISTDLSDLPSSYSDINAIQRYSSGGAQTAEVMKLQQQLNELQNAYELLDQHLRTMNQHAPEHAARNPQDEQAKTSSLVFSGLGAGVDNLVGSGAGSSSSSGSDRYARTPFGQLASDKSTDLVATQQQADLFQKQAENVQKVAVMKAAVDKDKPDEIYDLHSMVKPISKYQIQAGTIISATLITGIDTAIAGTIVAQVRQDLYDTVTGKHLLIPKGSKLLGEYDSKNVSYGQRRIAMWYTRIICPNGTSILLGKPAGADMLGQAGVEGSVDNHWARIIGAATISTLLSVGVSVWANQGVNNANNQTTVKQNAGAGAAQGISDVGNQLTSKAMGIAPTITLPPGHQFTVTVKKDMVLTPYKRS
ncbi:MAG: conjugal transfer protein [uncultured bacterium]|nr:MAG: conjugal transfer protein [uncultured bacterium]